MHRTHAGHGSIWPAETSGKPAEARASDQSTLTAERIAELRELLAMATPGRWVACDCAEAEDVDAAEGLAVFPTTEFEQDADAPAAIVYMSENWGEFADNAALIVAMHNTLPDLLDAAERLERQVRAKQQEIEEIAARAQENYERALAAERLASRAREDALREGFLAGFLASGEGFNGEYPFDYDRADIEANEGFAERVRVFINKPKGGDANDKSKERTRDPATSPGVITGASGEAKQVDPDWFWCDIDPDESGDSAYQAMHSYRPRLEPVELGTSYAGPKLWGVMSPPLPDADNDEETAHTFDTREAAQAFCDERNAIFNGAALCPSEGGDRG